MRRPRPLLYFAIIVLACSARAQEQPAPASLNDTLRELQNQIRELQASVKELREEAARYRAETLELRKEIARPATVAAVSDAAPPLLPVESSSRLAKVEEDVQLLSERVDENYQTKVESASKYRVRFSGMLLFNLFNNHGGVDNIDNPTQARAVTGYDSRSAFGGTLRQSVLGFQAFGPDLLGARTSADLQFDFAGGFPEQPNGVSFGEMRLRKAVVRLAWANTSVIAGQDELFFAPLTPTSLASFSTPPLAYAGNLWGWIPQLRVEHKLLFSDSSNLKFSAGILDGITGEQLASDYLRDPQAGEKSGQPAVAARVAWTHNVFRRPLTIGVGTYYNRQNWGFGRKVTGWAGTSDIEVPLGPWFTISGEFYRGRALGGFGGGISQSLILNGPLANPTTTIAGLETLGGWAQFKFAPTSKLEFNAAAGEDSPDSSPFNATIAPIRNRAGFVNTIYRPRSNLAFSLEYRRLRTFDVPAHSDSARQINLSMGVLF